MARNFDLVVRAVKCCSVNSLVESLPVISTQIQIKFALLAANASDLSLGTLAVYARCERKWPGVVGQFTDQCEVKVYLPLTTETI